MFANRTTLNQFLIEERQRHPAATGDLNSLINDVVTSCKLAADRLASGLLGQAPGTADAQGNRNTVEQTLADFANDVFLRSNEWGGHLAGLLSEDMEAPFAIPPAYRKGQYLLVFDCLEGLNDIDINVPLGSIFAILRAPRPGVDAATADFLQPGRQQVCAGYAIYGPSTMLAITVGTGVHGFTLDARVGEFILTHPAMRVASAGNEFAINASNTRFWEPAVKRYVAECMAGQSGPRHKDFNMRWVASLVAETHRILVRGGVFLHPRNNRETPSPGVQLLCKANPIAFLIEQAGGSASTGRERILDVVPTALHQRVPLMFGARDEVAIIEAYHRELNDESFDAPLFGSRGLFRATA